jgi:mannose-6-phosphate isomerase
VPIGESWEISDRPRDVSVIANGPLAGRDLHWLMENRGTELLGNVPVRNGRFPLLIKILDAQEKLSLQVHPPVGKARALGGEPKTELWYIADAAPGAALYVGLKSGVTRAQFEAKLENGSVEECFHRIEVRPGDAMFLPSGRVHALGAGLVIFEIQQNSDTTYRVFDWNRLGLDGQPRALHIRESLESIDFKDFEPALVQSGFTDSGPQKVRTLVRDPLFEVDACQIAARTQFDLRPQVMQIVGVLTGQLQLRDGQSQLVLSAGQFCLVPASLERVSLWSETPTIFLRTEVGRT